MALINCPECGKEISDLSKSCPNCGINFRKKMKPKKLIIIILTFIMLVGGGITGVILFTNYQKEKEFKQLAQPVINLIDDIQQSESIIENKVIEAKNAFDNLNIESKAYVTNSGVLDAALKDIVETANSVIELIDKIQTVTSNSEEVIVSAKNAYNNLSDYTKKLVTNYDKLINAIDAYEKIPIPLNIVNVDQYLNLDITFTDYKSSFLAIMLFEYFADVTANFKVSPLKDVRYEDVIVSFEYMIGDTVSNIYWKHDSITMKISPDGTASTSARINYDSFTEPATNPVVTKIKYLKVEGNIYKEIK